MAHSPNDAPDDGRRIGDLAEATGCTVRTLHHYEQIGLLVASGRSDAGHRRYSDADVDRLYRVTLLRTLGLPLAGIGQALDDPSWALPVALGTHLEELDRELDRVGGLRRQVSTVVRALAAGAHPSTDDLIHLLEDMTMLDANLERRISILVYEDLEAAHNWLVRVFGLGPGELTRDDTGQVVHAELDAGDGVVWLHAESPEFSLASPKTVGACTATIAVMVDDVDAHFRHAASEGATISYEPVDQPYGYREYSAVDLEGHLWSFMKPLG